MKAPAPILAPLAITEEGLNQLYELARDAGPQGLTRKDAVPLEGTRQVKIRDGVAILSVNGPLFRKSNIFSFVFGAPSYESILKDIHAALEDDTVGSLILDLDSPGGEAFGCGELSTAIYNMRGDKPIVGYVSGMCCSAAYWIGSACDRLVVDQSSLIGSIGVRQLLVDDSKMLDAVGIKEYQIVSTQSPYKVVDAASEGDRGRVKDNMTAMAAVFIDDVARNRGVSAATVAKEFGRGDVCVGKQAVEAGMADEVGDLESLIAELQSQQIKGASAMAKTKGGPAADMDDETCDGCDRKMGDGDELYCRACHGGAEGQALLAAIGAKTLSEAVATVTGWKQAAADTALLREKLEKQEAAARDVQFDAALAAATVSGVIPPAAEHPKRVYAMSLKGKEDGMASLAAYVAALGPAVNNKPATVTVASAAEPQQGSTPSSELTEKEKFIASRMGVSYEALKKNKSRRLALASQPAVVNDSDNDDLETA